MIENYFWHSGMGMGMGIDLTKSQLLFMGMGMKTLILNNWVLKWETRANFLPKMVKQWENL